MLAVQLRFIDFTLLRTGYFIKGIKDRTDGRKSNRFEFFGGNNGHSETISLSRVGQQPTKINKDANNI